MAEDSNSIESQQQRDPREPRVQPEASYPEARLHAFLERLSSLLSSVIALFLIAFVVVVLIGIVADVRKPLFTTHDYSLAALQGLDSAFLAIILLELLHTTLTRSSIIRQLQEFLVIGITAGVRYSLEVAASGAGSNPRDVVIDLTINAGAVLILVAALWLVRQQLLAERQDRAED